MELKDAWNQQSDRRADQPSIVRGAADGHARRVHTASVVAWMGMMQFRTAMAWQRKDEPDSVAPWFLRDSSGFQIDSELSPLSNEAVFDKITMSAFEGTPLTLALRDCGILSVAIVGIATEIGIEPTERHAAACASFL